MATELWGSAARTDFEEAINFPDSYFELNERAVAGGAATTSAKAMVLVW